MKSEWDSSIIVCDASQNSLRVIEEAILLAKSQTKTVFVYVSLTNENEENFLRELKMHGVSILFLNKENPLKDFLNVLDSFPLEHKLLILPLVFKTETLVHCEFYLNHKSSEISKREVVIGDYSRVSFLEKGKTTSDFIPEDTREWLQKLLVRYSKQEILNSLNASKKIQVALIGETIVDEYVYCESLGKVSKSPLIAFNKLDSVQQHGGVLAVAKHLSQLADLVYVFTEIREDLREFTFSGLPENVQMHADFNEKNSCTVKTRFLEIGSNVKLFETYEMQDLYPHKNDDFLSSSINDVIQRRKKFTTLSGVIVIDFGHGLISQKLARDLSAHPSDFSVNTQANAGNRGFNPISKYRGAKRVFINGSELELELRQRSSNRVNLIDQLAPDLGCEELFVTQGAAGLIYWTSTTGACQVPGFAPHIVDKVGAGDALMAVISILRIANVPIDIACFFGNIAGSILVGSIGNETSITYSALLSFAKEIFSELENMHAR